MPVAIRQVLHHAGRNIGNLSMLILSVILAYLSLLCTVKKCSRGAKTSFVIDTMRELQFVRTLRIMQPVQASAGARYMDDKIDSLLKESRVIHPTATTTAAAYVKDYEADYKASIADPEGFWGASRRNWTGLRPGSASCNGNTHGRNGS